MPASGLFIVEVSPFQASTIVWWLESMERSQQTTPIGLIAEAIALRAQASRLLKAMAKETMA